MAKETSDKEKEQSRGKLLETRESPVDVAAQKAEQAAGQALAGEEHKDKWDAIEFLYRELLTREQPPGVQEYFHLAHGLSKSEAPPENYTQHWSMLLGNKKREGYKEMIATLDKTLKGKVLIDLGGGRGEVLSGSWVSGYATYAPAPMQAVAERFKVKTYVNVDRYHTSSRDLIEPHNVTEDLGIEQPRGMHVVYEGGDMLTFLSKIPDQKTDMVLVLNGIDAFVIQKRSYREALAKEIARVVSRGGAVMTCGSEDITEYFKKLGFEVADGFSKDGGLANPQLWIKK